MVLLNLGSCTVEIENNLRCWLVEYEGEKTRVSAPTLQEAKEWYDKSSGIETNIAWWEEANYRTHIKVEKDPFPTKCREYKDNLPLVAIWEILSTFPDGHIDIVASTV